MRERGEGVAKGMMSVMARGRPIPVSLRGGIVGTVAVLLVSAAAWSQAPASKDALSAALRAAESAGPALASTMEEARRQIGEEAPAAPSELIGEATKKPEDLASGLRLAEGVEDWQRVMTTGGAWRLVMVDGAPEAQRRVVWTASRCVLELCASGVGVLDRAVEAADRAADAGGAPADDERMMAALHARQVVLPLRGARAAVVLAACAGAGDARRGLASAALELAVRVEPVSAWSEAERFVLSGWALALLGKHDEGMKAFERARGAAGAKDAGEGVRREAFVDASLGEALSLLESRGPVSARELMWNRLGAPPFVDAGAVDLSACLPGVDVLMVIGPREAALFHDAGARSGAMSWGWRAAGRLLERLDFTDRGRVYGHVAARTGAATVYESLPEVARVSCAWGALSRDEPETREAVRVLGPIADAGVPPTDVVRHDAWRLYVRAAAALGEDEALTNASALGRVYSACCGGREEAAEIVGTAAHAAERSLRSARSPEAAAHAEENLLALLRALCGESVVMVEEARDAWRLAMGRALLGLVKRGPLNESYGNAREAMVVLRQVSGDETGLEAEAALARVWAAMLRLAEEAEDEESPAIRVAQQLADMCDPRNSRAAGSASRRADLADVMLAYRGQALVALGRPADALDVVERLIGGEAVAAEEPATVACDAALEALVALERDGDARALLERCGRPAGALERASRLAWRRVAPVAVGFIAGEAPVSPPPPIAVFRLAAEAAGDEAHAAMHRTRLAWSLLLAGKANEAVEVFKAAHDADPASASVRRGLGEALLAVGDDAGAFAAFSEMARALEARQEFSRDYWHTWVRMLEILARRPRTPDENARIRREIARLRSMDEALKHPDCLVRIKTVEEGL